MTGAGRRATHWLTIPLCPECHTGKDGLHGTRARLKNAGVDEMDLLSETIRRLNEENQ